ncbi:MAG TPA: glycosyltransferase family 4 protein [Bacteroidales bacterium]|jgi:glycosyltransferase involved in cell wall biosynthesis|nr:glycosyltransferase family 4 protein [Bacteroidales bacterium]
MNILFLCNKPPYPAREGGPIAMNMLIDGLLEQGHQVKVLTISSYKYPFRPELIPDDYMAATCIEAVEVDLQIHPIKAFLNLFSKKSYHVERFISKTFRRRLINILQEQEFDIVQIETIFLCPYIPDIRKHSRAHIVLRSHNIEHLIWKRLWGNTGAGLKKAYLKHLWTTLMRYELGILDKVDGIAAITRKDAEFLRSFTQVPIVDISYGIDSSHYPEPTFDNCEIPSLFHIGSMDWMPNQEGIKWFLSEAWPKVYENFPFLKFYLAGRNMPEWLLNGFWPNVVVIGEVEDAREFMLSKWIMVVPLLAGSGIRVKIIEAMANARPIIASPIAAEGIEYTEGENILLASTPDEYLEAIRKCIENPEYAIQLGRNARQLVLKEHDRRKLITELIHFYYSLINHQQSQS